MTINKFLLTTKKNLLIKAVLSTNTISPFAGPKRDERKGYGITLNGHHVFYHEDISTCCIYKNINYIYIAYIA